MLSVRCARQLIVHFDVGRLLSLTMVQLRARSRYSPVPVITVDEDEDDLSVSDFEEDDVMPSFAYSALRSRPTAGKLILYTIIKFSKLIADAKCPY